MTKLLTLRETALLIKEKCPYLDEDQLFPQLRGTADRGLIKETDRGGPRSAKRFSLAEIVKARILLAALASGQTSKGLTQIANDMEVEEVELIPDGSHVTYSQKAALKSILDPNDTTDWKLQIMHNAYDAQTGEYCFQLAQWLRNGSPKRALPYSYDAITIIPVSSLSEEIVKALQPTEA